MTLLQDSLRSVINTKISRIEAMNGISERIHDFAKAESLDRDGPTYAHFLCDLGFDSTNEEISKVISDCYVNARQCSPTTDFLDRWLSLWSELSADAARHDIPRTAAFLLPRKTTELLAALESLNEAIPNFTEITETQTLWIHASPLVEQAIKDNSLEQVDALGLSRRLLPSNHDPFAIVQQTSTSPFDNRYKHQLDLALSSDATQQWFLGLVTAGSAYGVADYLSVAEAAGVTRDQRRGHDLRLIFDIAIDHATLVHTRNIRVGDAFDWVLLAVRACDFRRHHLAESCLRARACLQRFASAVEKGIIRHDRVAHLARVVTSMHAVRQLHAIEMEFLRAERTGVVDDLLRQLVDGAW